MANLTSVSARSAGCFVSSVDATQTAQPVHELLEAVVESDRVVAEALARRRHVPARWPLTLEGGERDGDERRSELLGKRVGIVADALTRGPTAPPSLRALRKKHLERLERDALRRDVDHERTVRDAVERAVGNDDVDAFVRRAAGIRDHVVASIDEPGGEKLGGERGANQDEHAAHSASQSSDRDQIRAARAHEQDRPIPPSPRILVIEDHELFAELLVYSLQLAGFGRVDSADPERLDLDSILRLFDEVHPDVVLLDLLLGPAGFATRYIEPLSARGAQVLILTASDDAVLLAECLEAGAAGVFSKCSPFAELLDVLVDAARGETVLSPAARTELLNALRKRRAEQRRGLDGFRDLTPREAAVLRALVDGRQAEEIAITDGVAVTTVRAQVRSILQKLGVNSQLAAVALAAAPIGLSAPPSSRPYQLDGAQEQRQISARRTSIVIGSTDTSMRRPARTPSPSGWSQIATSTSVSCRAALASLTTS
jgi:two-component system nitrate/nitrite response regulator NarL